MPTRTSLLLAILCSYFVMWHHSQNDDGQVFHTMISFIPLYSCLLSGGYWGCAESGFVVMCIQCKTTTFSGEIVVNNTSYSQVKDGVAEVLKTNKQKWILSAGQVQHPWFTQCNEDHQPSQPKSQTSLLMLQNSHSGNAYRGRLKQIHVIWKGKKRTIIVQCKTQETILNNKRQSNRERFPYMSLLWSAWQQFMFTVKHIFFNLKSWHI